MDKDLHSLIRLRKWAVDEKQRELGELLGREQMVENAIAQLEAQMQTERDIVRDNPTMAGFTFGTYSQFHKMQREHLQAALSALREKIDEMRDALADLYKEQKVAEISQDNRTQAAKAERERKTQNMLDEIAADRHQRKQP
jgi:flagellar export protein FliJ